MARRIMVTVFMALALVFVASCGKEAQKAIDAAQAAINDAKTAGAEQYAPQEYKSAEDYLGKARDQYKAKSFDPAKASAISAKDQAELAKKRALERKAAEDASKTPVQSTGGYNASSLEGGAQDDSKAILKDVHFDYDKSDLSDESKSTLVNNAKWLEQNPDQKVTIEGHCDERGSTEYNLALGERRAKSVRDYLVGLGIDHGRLSIISYGESLPLDPGHNEAAWAKNRRAHFAFTK
jgi:peptidoglycan-associated lipoprotein